jgi:hypothetical protein
MGEVMGAIGQGRLCELWQLALTPKVEAQHPWSEFRLEWSDWLFGRLGNVTEAGDPYPSALTWEVVAEETVGDRTRATVAVAFRGEPVAEFVMVSLPDWPAASEEDGGVLLRHGDFHTASPSRIPTTSRDANGPSRLADQAKLSGEALARRSPKRPNLSRSESD